MLEPSEYLRFAAECRTMAARTKNPESKRYLQEMENAWEMLAAEAEAAQERIRKRIST